MRDIIPEDGQLVRCRETGSLLVKVIGVYYRENKFFGGFFHGVGNRERFTKKIYSFSEIEAIIDDKKIMAGFDKKEEKFRKKEERSKRWAK